MTTGRSAYESGGGLEGDFWEGVDTAEEVKGYSLWSLGKIQLWGFELPLLGYGLTTEVGTGFEMIDLKVFDTLDKIGLRGGERAEGPLEWTLAISLIPHMTLSIYGLDSFGGRLR